MPERSKSTIVITHDGFPAQPMAEYQLTTHENQRVVGVCSHTCPLPGCKVKCVCLCHLNCPVCYGTK